MRAVLIIGVWLALVAQPASDARAQGFVAPQPQATIPQPPAAKPAPGSGRQRRAAAPASPCEQMTRDWVDHRPVIDDPAGAGLVAADQQGAAVAECQAEQARRPSDMRIAFIYARTLEVNGHSARALGLFQQLADAGYGPALTQTARAYYIGSGVPRDMFEACTRYIGAAKAGDAWAFNPAADCLSFQDFTHDPKLACRYFQKAQASGTFQSTDLTRGDYCQ
ncbi:MAG: hypothetical protein U1E34_11255 [Amaricoccus sp.]